MPLSQRTASTSGARPLAAIRLLAPLAMVLAMGCGGPQLMPTPNLYALTPDNPFADVPPIFRTSTVDVVYVTDREPEAGPANGPRYGCRRSKSLAFGITTVKIGNDVSWDDLVSASRSARRRLRLPLSTVRTCELERFPPVPTKEVEQNGQLVESADSVDARLAAEGRFRDLLAERLALTAQKEVYVFIHGAGSDFEAATYVVAGLWHFLGRRGVPVAYTWPSMPGGNLLGSYSYDRESSEFTVFHLKQFLRLLASCPGVAKVHVLAHSTGTNTILSALRELRIETIASGGDTRKALKLGCLVLAAADIDLEVSTQRVGAEHLMRVPEQTVLYVSPTDILLGLADVNFNSKGRLGQSRARGMTGRRAELLGHLPDIQFIDACVAGSGFGSHNYFCRHSAVSSDLILLLRDNRRPGAENGRPLASESGGFWRIDRDYPAPVASGERK